MTRYLIIATLLSALLLGGAAIWMAEKAWDAYELRDEPDERANISLIEEHAPAPLSLQTLIERLELPRDTRVLEVEREHHGERMYYEIELLTAEGRIYQLHVDPYTAVTIDRKERH